MARKSSDETGSCGSGGVFKCFPSSIFLDNLLAQLTENSFLDKPWLIHLELSIAGIVNSHRGVHRWGSPGHHKTPYTKSLHPFLSSCCFCRHPSFLSSTHKSTDPHILPWILPCILLSSFHASFYPSFHASFHPSIQCIVLDARTKKFRKEIHPCFNKNIVKYTMSHVENGKKKPETKECQGGELGQSLSRTTWIGDVNRVAPAKGVGNHKGPEFRTPSVEGQHGHRT